ncbi:MAG: glycosyltransferase [Endozoicomonadaceae bacterium]|nr:glycosyltransferase [Endozoicomonadaceae bacterium]
MEHSLFRIATIIPPLESGDVTFKNGLIEANQGLLEALVRYSHFTEFHFFVVVEHCTSVYSYWMNFLKFESLDRTIQVIPLHLLPVCLSGYEYSVFHCGDHHISPLLELREAYAGQMFPITGRVHSLCQDVLLTATRNTLLAPYHNCDALLCASHAAQKAMNRMINHVINQLSNRHSMTISKSIAVEKIPLGVEPEAFLVTDKQHVRRQLGLPEDALIILYLGRIDLSNKMDLHPLILALNEIVSGDDWGNDVILYLCGQASFSDDYVVSLVRTVGTFALDDCVLFKLDLDSAERNIVYAAADIFVSIADNPQETFGLAPIEAMAAGLPVVLSDWDGYRDLVEDGVSGFLVPTVWGDVDLLITPTAYYEPERNLLAAAQSVVVDIPVLSCVLATLLADKALRLRVGKAAQSRVDDQFTWKASVEQYEQLVRSLKQNADQMHFQHSGEYPGLLTVDVFKHYASRHLGDADVIKTTPRGRRVLNDSEATVCFESINHLVDSQFQSQVLEGALLGVCVDHLCDSIGLAKPQVIFNILWAMKHHLLCFSVEERCTHKNTYLCLAKYPTYPVLAVLDEIWALFQGDDCPDAWVAGHVKSLMTAYVWPLLTSIRSDACWRASTMLPSIIAPAVKILSEQLEHVRNIGRKSAEKMDIEGISSQELVDRFPLWGRQTRSKLVDYLQATKALIRRLEQDWQHLLDEFVVEQSGASIKIIKVEPLTKRHFSGATRIGYSNGVSIIYKPRDLRAEVLLINQHRNSECLSLAEQFNLWAEEDAIGCYRQIAMSETRRNRTFHYGYVECVSAQASESVWSQLFYRRVGMMTAFLLITGQGSADYRNIFILGNMPYPIDLSRSCSQRVAKALQTEMKDPALLNWEQSALRQTGISLFWNNPDDSIACDTDKHSQYATDVADGFRRGLRLIKDRQNGVRGYLQQLACLPVRTTVLTDDQHWQQVQDISRLHVFCESGLKPLYTVTKTMITRYVREQSRVDGGVGCLMSRYEKRIADAWLRGNAPCFQRLPGNTALLSSSNERADDSVAEDALYFSEPVLDIMLDGLEQLDGVRIDRLVEVYENWLSSLASEDPLEDNLFNWLNHHSVTT